MSTLIVGCGYLGQRVGSRLRENGEHVFGTVRSSRRAVELAALGITPVIADILVLHSLRSLPVTDRVFYCVGYDRFAGASLWTAQVDGLQNVLDNLPSSVSRFVYASSTGVYGQTGGEWVDESAPTAPRHESGIACLEAEARVRGWARERAGSARAIVLRFAGLYGPGRVVRRSIVEKGEPIPGDPDRFLNLIHIDDAAFAVAAALDAPQANDVYLISDDRPVTRREYYSLVAALLGASEPRFVLPGAGSPQESRDATNKRVSNQLMKDGLGICLRFPDITSGLPAAMSRNRRP